MKKAIISTVLVSITGFLLYFGVEMYGFADGVRQDARRLAVFQLEQQIRSGDLIFQTSSYGQSKAIQLATGSIYSHVGIIYEKDGEFLVYEAVQPVKLTPLHEWIKRGDRDHYVIKRLKDAQHHLTPEVLARMKEVGEQHLGKPYDLYFGWSDERIYCSELVWKIYDQVVGIELGNLQRLGEFDLTHPLVKEKLLERYGDEVPLDEKVISPGAMFDSEALVTVVKSPN